MAGITQQDMAHMQVQCSYVEVRKEEHDGNEAHQNRSVEADLPSSPTSAWSSFSQDDLESLSMELTSGYTSNTAQASVQRTPAESGAVTPNTGAEGNTAEAEERESTLLSFPPQCQFNAQNRHQLLQRFYDLHLGASGNARRIFNYEALDTMVAKNPDMIATTAAMDTL